MIRWWNEGRYERECAEFRSRTGFVVPPPMPREVEDWIAMTLGRAIAFKTCGGAWWPAPDAPVFGATRWEDNL